MQGFRHAAVWPRAPPEQARQSKQARACGELDFSRCEFVRVLGSTIGE